MKNADINLYVVRHNYTKIKTLGIVNNLYQQQLKNINIIINDYQYTKSSYGYGYGYGYATDGYGYYENEK